MAIPMDSEGFSQPTQPGSHVPCLCSVVVYPSNARWVVLSQKADKLGPAATQNVVDPRRLGKQNSGFSDEDVADIICLLIPSSESAKAELDKIASQTTAHLTRHGDAANVNLDLDLDDDASDFQLAPDDARGRALILRLSANVKDPRQGFTFGRNQMRCDVHFAQDPHRRLSNIHFRIYVNEYGVLMLEDKSTNGTVVDECLLKGKAKNHTKNKRTLSSGSRISILMHERTSDLAFLVRIPRRDGQYAEAYQNNLLAHRRRLRELDQRDQDPNATIVPGPGGHVSVPADHTRRVQKC